MPAGTKSIIIDPDETLPDGNRPNNANSKPLKFTWVFDHPQYYKREIFWMPWVFHGNQYNGFTPGVNLFHGFVPGYDYGIGLRPMWDVKNEQLLGTLKYMRRLYGWGNFYTSSFKADFCRNSGRSGIHLEFEGERKEHLDRYPVWTTIFHLDYHNILEMAVDTSYYHSEEIAVGYAEMELHNRPNPYLNYYFRTALKTGILHSQFLRLNLQTNIYYKVTKKIRTKLRIWVGGFLDSTELPRQYRTYLSGNIDPDFRNNFIFNRTPNANNWSIGTRQYDIDGPSLHGLVLTDDSTKKMLGVNDWVISAIFDITLPKIPAHPFADIAIIPGKKTHHSNFNQSCLD